MDRMQFPFHIRTTSNSYLKFLIQFNFSEPLYLVKRRRDRIFFLLVIIH